MAIKQFILGFFVKGITGLDDTITHIPVIASVSHTRIGKIAFSVGTIVAVGLAIVIALFFSSILAVIPYYRYIAAGLLFILAIAIYFDVFVHKPREKVESKIMHMKGISVERFFKLMGIGFIASFATVIDDIIAYSPVLVDGVSTKVWVIAGITIATILEIVLVIVAAEKINKIKYKEEIASVGLIILGVLILSGMI